MDRIELVFEDIELLFEWRDEHQEFVKSFPCPLKAVEILLTHNGFKIKGFRTDTHIKLNVQNNGKGLGNVELLMTEDGGLEKTRGNIRVDEDLFDSILSLYCTLMALIAYPQPKTCAPALDNSVKMHKKKLDKDIQKNTFGTKKPPTYILHNNNGQVYVRAVGSHRSPTQPFSVRGHYRRLKSGKLIWIDQYQKCEVKSQKSKPHTYKTMRRPTNLKKKGQNNV